MPQVKRSQAIWAISDGRAGNLRQAMALAAAVAGEPTEDLVVHPRAPWRWLAPRRLYRAQAAFAADFAQRLQHPPVVAIGCGRQAALATRLLRAHGSHSVQILDPRINPRHWDLLVVPQHDRVRASNVLTLLGSLNPVDDAWLQQGREDFPELAALPSPRIALLLGGPTAHVPWQLEHLSRLCAQLVALARQHHGSVLVTASRRTPTQALQALHHPLREVPSLLWHNEDDGPNPYRGLLGWADALVSTADSVNLLSEACATRLPVASAFSSSATGGRMPRFLQALDERARLCDIDALLHPHPALTPLRETQRIAAQVRQHLNLPNPH
jgi:mitochondrial fission protein ELM1